MPRLTKDTFKRSKDCLTKAWRDSRADQEPFTEEEAFRNEQGKQIGELARSVYPNGRLVDQHGEDAVVRTRELLADPNVSVIFEAAVKWQGWTARADILRRSGTSWELIEAKSSNEPDPEKTGGPKKKDLLDIAYTATVLLESGVPLNKAILWMLSRDYRFGDPLASLFEELEVSEVLAARTSISAQISALGPQIVHHEEPQPSLVKACKKCNYFAESCIGQGVEFPVTLLPRLSETKTRSLANAGILDVRDIPNGFDLTANQSSILTAIRRNEMSIQPGLQRAIDQLAFPCYYLDFETLSTAIPLYAGLACYQAVITQYSVHRWDAPDVDPEHGDYLAYAERYNRRELAESLIEDLGAEGPIVVYSPYENTHLKKLAEEFPDLAPQLNAARARLVDLKPILEANVYHPDFKGSYSIKKVLPALVPGLSYEGLSIANGTAANIAFARMARKEVPPGEIARLRQDLLDYCELDTLAMLRLHQALRRMVDLPGPALPQTNN